MRGFRYGEWCALKQCGAGFVLRDNFADGFEQSGEVAVIGLRCEPFECGADF